MSNIVTIEPKIEGFSIEQSACGEDIDIVITNSIVKLYINFSSRDLYKYLSGVEVESSVRMIMRKGGEY